MNRPARTPVRRGNRAVKKYCSPAVVDIYNSAYMNKSTGTNLAQRNELLPLSALKAGQSGCVHCTRAAGDQAERLSGLGVFAGVRVEVVRSHDPMIVRLLGTRVGMARAVARAVLVRLCLPDGAEP